MRTQYITLAANEVKTFESAGGYFEILRAANDLARIDWITEDGGFSDPWELVKEGVFGYLPFKGFRITNGPTAQTIKVLFGQGSGGNRAAPVSGSVGITGAPAVKRLIEKAASAGKTFSVLGLSGVINSGQFRTLAIVNPVGSGLNVFVPRCEFSTKAGTIVDKTVIKFETVTNIGSLVPQYVDTPMGAGVASSSAFITTDALTGVSIVIDGGTTAAPIDGKRDLDGLCLAPGQAVQFYALSAAAASEANARVFWFEDPI